MSDLSYALVSNFFIEAFRPYGCGCDFRNCGATYALELSSQSLPLRQIANVSAWPGDTWNLASNYRTGILQIPPTCCIASEFYLTLFWHKTFCRLLEFNFFGMSQVTSIVTKLNILWLSLICLIQKKAQMDFVSFKTMRGSKFRMSFRADLQNRYNIITENIDEINLGRKSINTQWCLSLSCLPTHP